MAPSVEAVEFCSEDSFDARELGSSEVSRIVQSPIHGLKPVPVSGGRTSIAGKRAVVSSSIEVDGFAFNGGVVAVSNKANAGTRWDGMVREGIIQSGTDSADSSPERSRGEDLGDGRERMPV